MWIFQFYRFYLSVACGIVAAFFVIPIWWFGLCVAIVVRICWAITERMVERKAVNRQFKEHAYEFKQQFGPYGIRLINKAEKEYTVKKQLAEVFTNDVSKLRKTIENLEMMDTLFKAGMRPDGDTWQLHDLKLKYGKYRIERYEKEKKDAGALPASSTTG
jgi:hypothetical protein